ncbi:MAG: metallophosphoesterase [Leptospiraceae bacterium]|nr:metallophosphoesterase [Leptospiraceae bacterium]
MLLATILGFVLGISTFFRAHILWCSATVFLPAFLFIYAIKNRTYFLIILVIPILLIKFYAEKMEPNDLDVEKITIHSKKVKSIIRITHISDLQTDDIRELHKRVRKFSDEFNPHIILFTGDVLNHISIQKEVENYLLSFKKKDSSYFVSGNVDGILDLKVFTKNIGFEFFDNQSKTVTIENNEIGLIGLGLNEYNNEKLIYKLSSEVSSTKFKILMSHYPDSILYSKNSDIDLILSGHTHGGQVCLPWFGPIITLSNVPRKIAAGGLHFFNDKNIIVSRGLGMEGHIAPRIRFFSKPHLVLLEIVPD